MKKITLVRHGETFQNRHHQVQGSDPTQGRLTEKGIHQAALLGNHLAGRKFDKVYCSPLERAVLTMSQILVPRVGERTLPIEFAPELKEINLGVLHGRSHEEWRASITGDAMAFVAEGGESWLDVQRRATAYLREQVLPGPETDLLIVAHGGVNRGIIASLTGITMGEAWAGPNAAPQDNTCVNLLEVNGDGELVQAEVNDTTHLMGEYPGAGPGQRWLKEERCWASLATEAPAPDALQA